MAPYCQNKCDEPSGIYTDILTWAQPNLTGSQVKCNDQMIKSWCSVSVAGVFCGTQGERSWSGCLSLYLLYLCPCSCAADAFSLPLCRSDSIWDLFSWVLMVFFEIDGSVPSMGYVQEWKLNVQLYVSCYIPTWGGTNPSFIFSFLSFILWIKITSNKETTTLLFPVAYQRVILEVMCSSELEVGSSCSL